MDSNIEVHENHPTNNYLPLVDKNDMPEIIEAPPEMEFRLYPTKKVSTLGMARVALTRKFDPNDYGPLPAYTLSNGIPKVISYEDAVEKGLYELNIEIDNPLARFRKIDAYIKLSVDGVSDALIATIDNLSEFNDDDEETHLQTWRWSPKAKEKPTLDAGGLLFTTSNAEDLSRLFFGFEVLQGGDN